MRSGGGISFSTHEMFRDELRVSGIPCLRRCILMLREIRYSVIKTSRPFKPYIVMNEPFRPVGQSGTSFQVVTGADGDIDHPRTGKHRQVGEGIEHLRTTSDYLGIPSVRRNMKTFCGFLRVGITWFLVTMEFWEEMD